MKYYGVPTGKILNHKYFELTKPLRVFSEVIGLFEIPISFVCDLESVPFLKGTSPISGIIHDYLCRKDSEPKVSKEVAADVYKESLKTRGQGWFRRNFKYGVVRVWPGYFHQLPVDWKP